MRYIVVILSLFLLASCSVKKRTYREGYYIDWAFQKKASQPVKKVIQANRITSIVKEEIPPEIVSSKSSDDLNNLIFVDKGMGILLMDTCGDMITFKSGDQVLARVTEITEDKIKYKRCDNLDGPVFVVNKGTVATVRYANGVVEKIEAPQPVYGPDPYGQTGSNQNTYKGPKKVHPKAIWALLSLLLLWWLFGVGIILGGILSYYAMKEITAKPEMYRGMMLAKIVYIICKVLVCTILGIIILSTLGI